MHANGTDLLPALPFSARQVRKGFCIPAGGAISRCFPPGSVECRPHNPQAWYKQSNRRIPSLQPSRPCPSTITQRQPWVKEKLFGVEKCSSKVASRLKVKAVVCHSAHTIALGQQTLVCSWPDGIGPQGSHPAMTSTNIFCSPSLKTPPMPKCPKP